MEYFKKLNQAWREGINATIQDCDGGERPEVASAYREVEARSLLELKIARSPRKTDLAEINTAYINFTEGWDAARRSTASSMKTQGNPIRGG